MSFDDDNFIHITDTVVYVSYLDGNTTRQKLLGTAKNATFEKMTNYKYKSAIGLAGKPAVIFPSLKVVKGSIEKFVVSSESFETKYEDHPSFYNMMQGFKVGTGKRIPEINQFERAVNLIFVHNNFTKTMMTTINGCYSTTIKRSFNNGFLIETFEFIGYDMKDEVF